MLDEKLRAQEEKVEGFLKSFGSEALFVDWCRVQGIKGIPNDTAHCLVAQAIYNATGVSVTIDTTENDEGDDEWQYNLTVGYLMGSEFLPKCLQEVPRQFDGLKYPEFLQYPDTVVPPVIHIT